MLVALALAMIALLAAGGAILYQPELVELLGLGEQQRLATDQAALPRLRELAAGRYGERAGDVLLLARNGNVDSAEQRYYFAGLYHSWHGSPSRQESEVPLIVAHPRRARHELAAITRRVLGDTPRQQDLAKLFMHFTLGTSDAASASR